MENIEEKKTQQYAVILYYKYTHVKNLEKLQLFHENIAKKLYLLGRIRISHEGINGTISSTNDNIEEYKKLLSNYQEELNGHMLFKNIHWKHSTAKYRIFPDFYVKKVHSLIELNTKEDIFLDEYKGKHLEPKEFHELLVNKDNDIAIIDVRDDHEYEIGHFKQALNPKMENFTQFKGYIKNNIEYFEKKKKILMYCTGGIRCETASCYLNSVLLQRCDVLDEKNKEEKNLQKKLPELYQLNGGIHHYLEQYGHQGEFIGKNYVFDYRNDVSPKDSQVISSCTVCKKKKTFKYSGDKCCQVCRNKVLVCETCREERNGYYFCDRHVFLDGIYYYFLENFTNEELNEQKKKILEIIRKFQKNNSNGYKKRRKLMNNTDDHQSIQYKFQKTKYLLNQVVKINELKILNIQNFDGIKKNIYRCRSCKKELKAECLGYLKNIDCYSSLNVSLEMLKDKN